MNKLSISLILASLSASSLLAIRTPAEQVLVENTIIECNPAGNTAEMKQCAVEQYEAADEKLNKIYQLALSQLDGEAKQRLKEAQRSWINFRDKTCSFEASSALGGTLEGLLYTGCLTEQSEKRTVELEGYFNDRASTFFGGGYTVTIEGSGGSISYRGCNSKNKCMYIPAASDRTQEGYTWENEGFTYKMSPVNNTGKYRLKIINPEGKMLVNQILSRMG